MKLLITGANGFLGGHLCRSMKDRYEVVATGKGEKRVPFDNVIYASADITSEKDIRAMVSTAGPDVIIHTAAMSKPDECEKNKALCTGINVNGTRHLIEAATALNKGIHFIYISTDFVLGDNGPHTEDAVPAPLNFYGESKLAAEKIVEKSGLFCSIVRPVFMYGEIWEGMRPTFLHWVKENLENGKPIKVVSDQQRTPTYVGDICKGIQSIIDNRADGLFHLAGEEALTPYDMAVAFAAKWRLDGSLIEPVTAATFKEPVRRAGRGGLLIQKARAVLGYTPTTFNEGLQRMA
jgi:dTDP-4-dehydrorhamnose reductase